METLVANLEELQQRKQADSVLLLREMQDSDDLLYRKELFEYVYNQDTTHISEVLEGQVRTVLDFDLSGDTLFLREDGHRTDWLELHRNGVTYARTKAAVEVGLEPYARISELELEEAIEQRTMIAAGQPATMVKLSLIGDDLMNKKQLLSLGRQPEKQRAFLRVSVFDGQKLTIDSRSIDGMSVADGRQFLAANFGIELPEDSCSLDVLENTVRLSGARHDLADQLVPMTGRDSYAFVLEQQDLLNGYFSAMIDLARRKDLSLSEISYHANDLRYDIMSAFKRRFEGYAADANDIMGEIALAGAAERANGTDYLGCDTVVNSPANSAGYLNAQLSQEFKWRSGFCRVGYCPTGKNQTSVGPCDVCAHCQGLFDRKLSLSQVEKHNRGIMEGSQKNYYQKTSQEGFGEWWHRIGQEIKYKNQMKQKQEQATKPNKKSAA